MNLLSAQYDFCFCFLWNLHYYKAFLCSDTSSPARNVLLLRQPFLKGVTDNVLEEK